jgi:hypothetical protein
MINPNSSLIFILASIVIVFVLIQSIYFIRVAWKRAKELGITSSSLGDIVKSSAVFSIVPSVSISMGILVLSGALGLAIPWVRLSVIGSLAYETTAAAAAASSFGYDLSSPITDPKTFSAIVWAMSLGTLPAFIIVPIFGKRLENGMSRIESRDKRWRELLGAALFIGMISTFVGAQFAHVTEGLTGWIPVMVGIVSALIMYLCNTISRRFKTNFMENYALPISMLGAMLLSLPITNLVTMLDGVSK